MPATPEPRAESAQVRGGAGPPSGWTTVAPRRSDTPAVILRLSRGISGDEHGAFVAAHRASSRRWPCGAGGTASRAPRTRTGTTSAGRLSHADWPGTRRATPELDRRRRPPPPTTARSRARPADRLRRRRGDRRHQRAVLGRLRARRDGVHRAQDRRDQVLRLQRPSGHFEPRPRRPTSPTCPARSTTTGTAA